MLASALIVLALAPALQQDPLAGDEKDFWRILTLNSMDTGEEVLMLQGRSRKLDQPKISPLHGYQFEHVAFGLTRVTEEGEYVPRFRVFNQYRALEGDKTDLVVRMMLRLWDMNRRRLNWDHSDAIHKKIVDVYLCFGGEAGAEQKFLKDPYELDSAGRSTRVNNIYVYAITTIDEPLEFARELAHEYGHATLPGIAGYDEPEEWAVGDIGERVYMSWLLQGMKDEKIFPNDVMQTSLEDMQAYYDLTVLPDLTRVASKGPNLKSLARKDLKGYNELLGLTSYLSAILPNRMFGRSVSLNAEPTAMSYLKAVLDATEEKEEWVVTIPSGYEKDWLWVPLRRGTVSGASVVNRVGDWVKIFPTSDKVTVHNELEG